MSLDLAFRVCKHYSSRREIICLTMTVLSQTIEISNIVVSSVFCGKILAVRTW